jgi:hypothetical protein
MRTITATEFPVNPRDVLLLQYLYSQNGRAQYGSVGTLFRVLAGIYGPALPEGSLRHAVLAFAAAALDSPHFASSVEYHQGEALTALVKAVPLANEPDIVSAFLLAWPNHSMGQLSHANQHVDGLMAMLGVYLKRSHPSDFMAVFGPFMFSLADEIRLFISLRDYGSVGPGSRRNATFTQWHLWHSKFIGFDDGEIDQRPDLIAIVGLLYGHSFLLSYAVIMGRGSNEKLVKDVIELVRSELRDPVLIHTLSHLTISKDYRVVYETPDVAFLSHDLYTIEILIRLLDAPTILEGLTSPPVVSLARSFINSLRRSPKAEGRRVSIIADNLRFSFYFWHLLTAGLGLTAEENPDGMTIQ